MTSHYGRPSLTAVTTTGDTKVVDRGKGDGIFMNTAGIGVVEHGQTFAPSAVRPGDPVLFSGDGGRHGIAIMATREGLWFETTIESDGVPLWEPVRARVRAGIAIHCLRDLTRGGLSSALIEIAELHRFALNWRKLRFRSRKMYLVRARFSGWIPSTLPRKAALSPLSPSAKQCERYRFSQSIPSVGAVRIGQVPEKLRGLVTIRSR
jgi:hydrogenase expression/formation protein HypE